MIHNARHSHKSSAAKRAGFNKKALAVFCFLAVLILVAVYAISVFRSISGVKDLLSQGKTNLEAAYANASSSDFKKAARSFQLAHSNFADSNKILSGPGIKYLGSIPFANENLIAVEQLNRIGLQISLAGDYLAKASMCFSEKDGKIDIGFSNGAVDIAKFAEAKPYIEKAYYCTQQAVASYEKIPDGNLIGQIKTARDQFGEKLPKLYAAVANINDAFGILPAAMGANEKRAYFIAIQNDAELRATGGLVGNYGVLMIDKGKLKLIAFDEISMIQYLNVKPVNAPEDFVARYGKYKSTSMWANVNFSPDFPTVSKVMLDLYRDATGVKLDGVIGTDPVGLAYMLDAIGPISLAGESVVIDSGNAVDWTLIGAYSKYTDRDKRKNFLADLARGVWSRVATGQIDDKSKLVDQISLALREKHLILFSTHEDEQKLVENLGYAGAITPTDNDYVQVIMQNHGANKVDIYMHEKIKYTLRLQQDGSARAHMSIDLANKTPVVGLTAYVLGDNEIGMKGGEANTWLNVFVPQGSRLSPSGTSSNVFDVDKEKDKTVFSGHVRVKPGLSKTTELSYEIPDVLVFRGNTVLYSLDWQIQSVINKPEVYISIEAPENLEFIKLPSGFVKKGKSVVFEGILPSDQKFEFTLADNT